MSITCLLSHTYHDLRCPVCGEGFLILAKADNLVTRMQVRREVGEALRAHHTHLGATDVHPSESFKVTGENGSPMEWLHVPLTYTGEAATAA